jgi:hypothetical protein
MRLCALFQFLSRFHDNPNVITTTLSPAHSITITIYPISPVKNNPQTMQKEPKTPPKITSAKKSSARYNRLLGLMYISPSSDPYTHSNWYTPGS